MSASGAKGEGGRRSEEELGRKKLTRPSESGLDGATWCVWGMVARWGGNKNGGSHQGRPWWLLVFGETGLTESTT